MKVTTAACPGEWFKAVIARPGSGRPESTQADDEAGRGRPQDPTRQWDCQVRSGAGADGALGGGALIPGEF